jgi:hypothetical protein
VAVEDDAAAGAELRGVVASPVVERSTDRALVICMIVPLPYSSAVIVHEPRLLLVGSVTLTDSAHSWNSIDAVAATRQRKRALDKSQVGGAERAEAGKDRAQLR